MYIVNIYEQDFLDEDGKECFIFVGSLKGKFLTERDAKLKIKSQDEWCQRNFIFKIVEVNSNEHQ